mmetsp:Transcript_3711/g.14994  ORF Transcript_3711/g.14994 Transcript_3711/m.14994 type:complete len:593 (+) Transcript_3711:920-2698(+)
MADPDHRHVREHVKHAVSPEGACELHHGTLAAVQQQAARPVLARSHQQRTDVAILGGHRRARAQEEHLSPANLGSDALRPDHCAIRGAGGPFRGDLVRWAHLILCTARARHGKLLESLGAESISVGHGRHAARVQTARSSWAKRELQHGAALRDDGGLAGTRPPRCNTILDAVRLDEELGHGRSEPRRHRRREAVGGRHGRRARGAQHVRGSVAFAEALGDPKPIRVAFDHSGGREVHRARRRARECAEGLARSQLLEVAQGGAVNDERLRPRLAGLEHLLWRNLRSIVERDGLAAHERASPRVAGHAQRLGSPHVELARCRRQFDGVRASGLPSYHGARLQAGALGRPLRLLWGWAAAVLVTLKPPLLLLLVGTRCPDGGSRRSSCALRVSQGALRRHRECGDGDFARAHHLISTHARAGRVRWARCLMHGRSTPRAPVHVRRHRPNRCSQRWWACERHAACNPTCLGASPVQVGKREQQPRQAAERLRRRARHQVVSDASHAHLVLHAQPLEALTHVEDVAVAVEEEHHRGGRVGVRVAPAPDDLQVACRRCRAAVSRGDLSLARRATAHRTGPRRRGERARTSDRRRAP